MLGWIKKINEERRIYYLSFSFQNSAALVHGGGLPLHVCWCRPRLLPAPAHTQTGPRWLRTDPDDGPRPAPYVGLCLGGKSLTSLSLTGSHLKSEGNRKFLPRDEPGLNEVTNVEHLSQHLVPLKLPLNKSLVFLELSVSA